MSYAPASRPRRNRLLRVVAAIGLLSGLAGCVIAPAPYYHDYGYHHHHYYGWR